MAKYQAPVGVTGINIGGQQFNADSKGVVTVPDDGNYVIPEGYTRVDETSAPVVAKAPVKPATE